jgi:hypothetical protein
MPNIGIKQTITRRQDFRIAEHYTESQDEFNSNLTPLGIFDDVQTGETQNSG